MIGYRVVSINSMDEQVNPRKLKLTKT